MKKLLLSLFLCPLLASAQRLPADLVIVCQRVYTATSSKGVFDAVAIKEGKILEVGTRKNILEKYKTEDTINEDKKFLYPGFIDAHCHFSGYALDKYKCDLVGTSSFEEILGKLTEYEKTNKLGWVYGRGWDQNDWTVKEFPNNEQLNQLFPDKPVILKRIDGHAVLCNNKALEMAKLTIDTKIAGGILEQKNGKLTGILIDNATQPVEDLISSLPQDESLKYLRAAEQECYALGLTGVVDCGVTAPVIKMLQGIYAHGELSISNTILLSSDEITLSRFLRREPIHAGQLHISGVKIYADGALGSRGACLLKDYADMPGHRGMLLTSLTDMKKIAEDALKNNWQVCTHAIGDSANRTILKLYAELLSNKNDKRWRVEHAQVVASSDYGYFGKYSIVPSVQPTHATSDMPWAGTRLGTTRLPTAYAYKSLLKQNGWIALGTDFPVEAINPLATFYAAIARKDRDGNPKAGFLMENALTRNEALMGMTAWAAKSVFNEKTKGSIEAGKDADLVILDQDIMTVPENKILSTRIIYTLVQGKKVYKK